MRPRFGPGDRVIVLSQPVRGHYRTPFYIRGKTGAIERVCGEFRNPESLAYGGEGLPRQPLYRVRFPQAEVWPDYEGKPGDTVDVEIYEHWLAPAAEQGAKHE